jgi:hypothetical protein
MTRPGPGFHLGSPLASTAPGSLSWRSTALAPDQADETPATAEICAASVNAATMTGRLTVADHSHKYVQSATAREIMRRYGFVLPGE